MHFLDIKQLGCYNILFSSRSEQVKDDSAYDKLGCGISKFGIHGWLLGTLRGAPKSGCDFGRAVKKARTRTLKEGSVDILTIELEELDSQ